MTQETKYRLVVDTNQYAGNFERESIAFATGQVGECGVGMGEADEAHDALTDEQLAWWEAHVIQHQDDRGVLRPAYIYPTPGMFNNGVGGHFPCTDEGRTEALAAYKVANESYYGNQLARMDLIKPGVANWTEENIQRERDRLRGAIETSNKATSVKEHPAYMSVAVEVDELPSEELLAVFHARMREFLEGKKVQALNMATETETIQRTRSRSNTP
jgi:hypothetical protein